MLSEGTQRITRNYGARSMTRKKWNWNYLQAL